MILIRHLFSRGNILVPTKNECLVFAVHLSVEDLFSLSSWNSAVNHKKSQLHFLPEIIQNIHCGYSNLIEIKSLN